VESQRLGFKQPLDRAEADDVLPVSKFYRIGRNASMFEKLQSKLSEIGVPMHCRVLRGANLAIAAGEVTMQVMQVLCGIAEFDHDHLIVHTQSGRA